MLGAAHKFARPDMRDGEIDALLADAQGGDAQEKIGELREESAHFLRAALAP